MNNLTDMERMELVLDVTDHFDFEKVEKVMQVLKWEWKTDQVNGIPTLAQIRKGGREACLRAIQDGYFCSGGYEAIYKDQTLELKFIVESWDSFMTRG